MKIKLIPVDEKNPSINEQVLAVNYKGYLGVSSFDGEKWVSGEVTHWIEFEA